MQAEERPEVRMATVAAVVVLLVRSKTLLIRACRRFGCVFVLCVFGRSGVCGHFVLDPFPKCFDVGGSATPPGVVLVHGPWRGRV